MSYEENARRCILLATESREKMRRWDLLKEAEHWLRLADRQKRDGTGVEPAQ
jgi:hypothetical protein